MATLSVEVATRAEFARLEAQWNELLVQSASNTITLTHQWLSTWWDVFGADRELCVLLVRDGESLVGIAPLQKRTVRHFGVLSLCRLEFLASGEDEFDEICSDYLDFILHPGREAEIIEAILTFLLAEGGGWDELVLTDIAGESVNLSLLQSAARRRGLCWQTTREEICIYVPFTTPEALMNGLRGPYRKNISKDKRSVEKQSDRVQIQMIDSLEEFDAGFEILMRLHQERWTSRGKPGSFASEKFTRFHRQLAPLLLPHGWLRLWVLWVDGNPTCALYDFFYNRKIFYYQSGLGQGRVFLRSAGLFLRHAGMEAALKDGYTECDFLKGEPDSYKFDWGAESRPIVQVRLARRSFKESVFQLVNTVIKGLRPLKRRLQALRRPPGEAKLEAGPETEAEATA